MAFAQSKSVFLNLKVGQSTYQDAVTQIKNSTYRNFMKIRDGKIFIVGTSVKQNGGKVWDHADIFSKMGMSITFIFILRLFQAIVLSI